jgi:hypothetical protein
MYPPAARRMGANYGAVSLDLDASAAAIAFLLETQAD